MTVPAFDPPTHEAHPDEDELPTLPDLLPMLEHAVKDLDLIDEHLAAHRSVTDDAPTRLALHDVDSFVNLAWGHARVALTALRELLAVQA